MAICHTHNKSCVYIFEKSRTLAQNKNLQMKKIFLLLPLFIGLLISSCGTTKPKVSDKPTSPETPTAPTQPSKKYLSKPGCVKWDDLPFAEKEKAANNYVLYRGALKRKDIKAAYADWKKVYEVAPAADGMRKTVYLDGVEFNNQFYKETTDTAIQRTYVNNIKRLYQEAMDCYGDEGYFNGLLGFDMYYNFPNHASDIETYHYLKKSIELDGEKTSAFVINPFTALMIDLYLKKKVPESEVKRLAKQIPSIIEYGLTKGDEKESYAIVASYTPARLEEMEAIKGFYDSDYYKKKYYGAFERNPTNCDSIIMTYSRLNWGQTPKTDPDLIKLNQAYTTNCKSVADPTGGSSIIAQAYKALREGRYREAVKLFDQGIAEESENATKAKYSLVNAKIYFSYLKSFSKSRSYARKALKYQPNMGAAYMLIGRLYASSGPVCGPGTGWASQIVTWPAIDKWQKAKAVDSSVAGEANKLIRRYKKYMPNKEEIFQHGYKPGGAFKVGCWIGENTVIRSAD